MEFYLRPATAQDLEDIILIWVRSFGDAPEFVRAFLTESELLSHAICAVAADHVQSVMFAFEGISFRGRKAAYLYALCTHPNARGKGMGTAVVRALAQRCLDRGAEIVFLSPADAKLAHWYQHILQANVLSGYDEISVKMYDTAAVCEQISPSVYFSIRHSDIEVSQQLLTAQNILHRFFGGGFFRISIDSEIAFACVDSREDGLLVRELICPGERTDDVCGALRNYFGVDRVVLRRPVDTGIGFVYITDNQDYEKSVNSIDISAFSFTLE